MLVLRGSDAMEQSPSSRRHKVLVVDDNQDAADSLAELLRLAGFEVQTAYDGAQAVSLASTFRPDVAVLDLNMPVVEGFAAAAALQRLNPPAVLLAFSCDSAPETMARVARSGFHRHLTKPADTEHLLRLLRSTLPTVSQGSQR
jgi:CheY-like chemotaxis protein